MTFKVTCYLGTLIGVGKLFQNYHMLLSHVYGMGYGYVSGGLMVYGRCEFYHLKNPFRAAFNASTASWFSESFA